MAIDTMQLLPSYDQMQVIADQITRIASLQEAAAVEDTSLSELEQSLAKRFAAQRNGKVFATKVWHYDVNHTSAGERMRDSVGLTCEPSTDTVEGKDDFEAASPIFQWYRCNYTRDADSTARVSCMEGSPAYRKTGAVDIGTLSPTFYWAVENHGTYDVWMISDSEHPELGLVPWVEAVTADGKVLPYYVDSFGYSVLASDGFPRAQAGSPVYNQSYNGMITDYQKKGTGYWGSFSSRTLLGYIFYIIKYVGKSSQATFAGCSSFNTQVKCALGETGVTRVLLTSDNGFYAGACVSVGTAGSGNDAGRQQVSMNSFADRVLIKSIEKVTIDSKEYTALNLDTTKTFDTTTDTYVSSMPCWTGQTDKVIGHHDGSYLSNTDGKHTFRIKGVEYMNGQAIIDSNVVMERADAEGLWKQYVAPKGVKHVANAHTGYVLAGAIPTAASDYWSGDVEVDMSTGNFNPRSIGSGNATGTGDMVWGPQSGAGEKGALREKWSLGLLWHTSLAGFCGVRCGYALGGADWGFGSCD